MYSIPILWDWSKPEARILLWYPFQLSTLLFAYLFVSQEVILPTATVLVASPFTDERSTTKTLTLLTVDLVRSRNLYVLHHTF